MDLNALISIVSEKGFVYFTGTSNRNGNVTFYFSTICGGRGDNLDISFNDGYADVEYTRYVAYDYDKQEQKTYKNIKGENLANNELFAFISEHL